MPSFRYESLTVTGQAHQGVVAAASRGAAVRLLGGRGETPTLVELVAADKKTGTMPARPGVSGNGAAHTGAATATIPRWRRGARPVASRSEMANLIRELATALEAGLPLMQALRTVRRQARGAAASSDTRRPISAKSTS